MNVNDKMEAPGSRGKYDWTVVKPGVSVHVDTLVQAHSIRASFVYWQSKGNAQGLKTTRRRVDHTDPDGPGYRIWFVEAGK
ncbi:hypothetical protein KLEP181_gp65 [Paracoccus phage vB_PmaP_KLEP18-1]|nr:hypothetical protein KLEP181_gp65 [Paracoccus phage vB_PmaP_KLEP18-1]